MHRTSVIRNGQMLGVAEQRTRGTVSSGSMQLLGEAKLQLFYNDGNNVGLSPVCPPCQQISAGVPRMGDVSDGRADIHSLRDAECCHGQSESTSQHCLTLGL